MNLFKRKSSEELIKETAELKAQLDNLNIKNKIASTHREVKKELSKQKRDSFDNSNAGKLLKGLKKEINKKQQGNKKKWSTPSKPKKKAKSKPKKKEERYISPLLRD